VLVVAGHVLAVWPRLLAPFDFGRSHSELSGEYPLFTMASVRGAFLAAAAILTIYYFGAAATSPFIYFRF
jgi:hypothetical protein